METTLYLNLRTKWVQLWEAFRVWIVNSPHVTPDAAKALPTKIKSGSSAFNWPDNHVKAILLQDVLDLTYSSVRDGISWTTHIRFKRASRSIYTRVTVAPAPPSALVTVKPPRIVNILKSRFGNMNVPSQTKPRIVCEGRDAATPVRPTPPPAPTTAITMIIAKTQSPKRKKRFGHEGNGLKGPKTRTMADQKRIFEKFLKTHPEDEWNTRYSRAHQCWLKHPSWDKAAKASGEAKGYATYKSLADAK